MFTRTLRKITANVTFYNTHTKQNEALSVSTTTSDPEKILKKAASFAPNLKPVDVGEIVEKHVRAKISEEDLLKYAEIEELD